MSRPTVSPGAPFSTTNALMPRCAGVAAGSVFASSRKMSARRPLVTHIFEPSMTYVSPSRLAVVEIACRSVPAFGSDRQMPRARFAFREPRQETLLLIRRAVLRQHVAEHEMRAEDAGEAHPAARQLLEDDREGGVVDFAAAVLLGDIEAEEAERLHRLDERVRVLVAVFHAGGNRNDLAIDELADRPRNQLLFLVQLEHGISWKAEK